MTETKSRTKCKIVKELKGFKGRACLVSRGSDFYVVSSVNAMFTGPETLAFRADREGEVTSWTERAGGKGMSRTETIRELEMGADDDRS